MLISCWSTKGGTGTTVVSVALAVSLAAREASGALLLDTAGDAPAVLGLTEPVGPGITEWLTAAAFPGDAALARLEIDAGAGLAVIPAGSARPVASPRTAGLSAALAGDPRPVVADCGVVTRADDPWFELAARASVSLLVLRPCYLALRRAAAAPVRPSAVVLVQEPGRALGRGDIEDALGVPVRAVVALDPAVARAVDAGLFAHRVPRSLAKALRSAA
ncbi:MAG: hypothetical protein AB7L13_02560 [Acidimicrobiia bacterium]